MHVWLDLIARELLFAALLTALGAGPAAFLSDRFDATARMAIAPAFGLCLGACLTVTLVYEYPAHETRWVLVAVAALSVAVAVWRRPPVRRIGDPRTLLQLATIVVVVLGTFSYPLAGRHTVGPVGGFQIADTSGYVSETDALARQSLRSARESSPPYSDLSTIALINYGRGTQQLDISALEANVNSLFGLGATDTQAPFLIAVLLAGALGAFAVARTVVPRPGWAAVLGGCLFAGPAFCQLLMEGSQAGISGAAVLTPVIAVGLDAIRRRSIADLILFGLAAAGLQTVYPLFVPCVVIGALVVLTVIVLRSVRAQRPTSRTALHAAGAILLVLACAVVFTPVAFSRNATYWGNILRGKLSFAGLPGYHLPSTGLPGWLLQTRDFYRLVNVLSDPSAGQLALGIAVPLLLLALIAVGMWRSRMALVMLPVIAGAIVLAYYTRASQGCSYCVQRNLIPVAALIPSLVAIGLGTVAVWPSRFGRWTAAAVALVTILAVGHEAVILRQRMSQADYMLDPGDREALAALPTASGRVELEGFSESAQAPMELPLVYNLADERTRGRVSVATLANDNSGLAYLTAGAAPLGLWFTPDYRYVLTRLAGVATQRQTIARFGSIALQRRVHELDVTALSGISVAAARLDPGGQAWVTPGAPLQFLVVGDAGGPAWVSLALRATVPVTGISGPGLVRHSQRGQALQICLRAQGSGPVRSAAVQTTFQPQPAPAPGEPFEAPQPPRGLALTAMTVSGHSCGSR